MSDKDRPAELEEIEVTPEMISAGVDAYSLFGHEDRWDWAVAEIYAAMHRARSERNE